MSGVIRRSCTICGALAEPGTSRCTVHPPGTGRHPRSCAGCGIRTEANRCPPCQAEMDERIRSRQPWRKEYATKEYRNAREQVRTRAAGRCEDCGRFAGSICSVHGQPIRTQADHVVAVVDGGRNTVANLRMRCACCCHASKSKADRRARSRR